MYASISGPQSKHKVSYKRTMAKMFDSGYQLIETWRFQSN